MPEAKISHKCTHQTHMLLGTKNCCNGSRPFSAYPAHVAGSVNSVQPCTLNVLLARGTRGLVCCKVCSGKTPPPRDVQHIASLLRLLCAWPPLLPQHRSQLCWSRRPAYSSRPASLESGLTASSLHNLGKSSPCWIKQLCMGLGSRVHGKRFKTFSLLGLPINLEWS